MNSQRPNPDELLSRVLADEARALRGKLKIFFGYAAGVGKTYAMLQAARRELADGVDVVVGYVEPHGRSETDTLLQGTESIPTREVAYRGVTIREFDLDAALARRPQLILVDELAHTNAEGSRHTKRWQDVQELLEAGIDVWTTMNVQHLESLNDVIAQIASIVVRETVPDTVLEQADEIELMDLTPEDLMERLQAGKVYIPAQAQRALSKFFQKGNLVALRELALRQVANRIQRDVETARRDQSVTRPWATRERLLVCVGPSPTTARLIRTAKRMASAFGGDWLAVSVETRGEGQSTETTRQGVSDNLRLAEQLGAEPHSLVGHNVAQTILEYARSRNVTKIIVGKTAQPWYRRWLLGTVVDQLLENSGEIDVYVIKGEGEAKTQRPAPLPGKQVEIRRSHYIGTLGVVALCALVGWLCSKWRLDEVHIVMVFLMGVVFAAARLGRGPAITAAILNVLVFDYLFVPPHFSFAISDVQYLLTFAVMLGIGLLISTLTARVQEQLRASQQQERRTAALYRLSKQLSELSGQEFLVQAAGQQFMELFAGEVALYLREPNGQLKLRFGQQTSVAQQSINGLVAQWVADHGRVAGAGTDTLPNATAFFVPLIGSQRTVGALGVKSDTPQLLLDPEQRRLLDTCESLVALAIERDQSTLDAADAQVRAKAEQVRNSLLSSVSHDLRTPLTAIAGAATSLLENSSSQNANARQELLRSVVDESNRLTRLVENLLEMTRLESGTVEPNKQWQVLEEITGSALARIRPALMQHILTVSIPPDLPLIFVDGLLLEQVLVNLIENATRYTPSGSKIELTALSLGNRVEIRIADNGPGLPLGSESRIFDKFFRGTMKTTDARRGVGLGLAICQAIVEAHKGKITANNRSGGGAEFVISLPNELPAPLVPMEKAAADKRI